MKNLPGWLKLLKGNLDVDDTEEVNLLLCDTIGDWDGVSAKSFASALAMVPKSKKIRLDINCLGGYVTDGTAMYNMLLTRDVTTCVIGCAASMGSIIALAGRHRIAMPGTMIMIHNPSIGLADGDHRDLQRTADHAKQVKDLLVDVYAERTKLSRRAISDMMDATTFMSPKEALDFGFIHEIAQGSPTWNNFDAAKFGAALFKNTVNKNLVLYNEANNKHKTNMHKRIIAALVALGCKFSAEVTEDEAAQVETVLTGLVAERDSLKTNNQKHIDAHKARVTNRVTKAIEDKKVKPERKDSLIAAAIADESVLDVLDDIIVLAAVPPAPAPTTPLKTAPRAGAPALPPKTGTDDENVDSLRAKLKDNRMNENIEDAGLVNAATARELRAKRGHSNLFAAPAQQ